MPAIQVARTDTFELQRQKINQIGDQIFQISAGGSDLATGNLKLGDGTLANPSLAFTSDAGLGIFKTSNSEVGYVFNNKELLNIGVDGLISYKDVTLKRRFITTEGISTTNPGQNYDAGSYPATLLLGGTGEDATATITVTEFVGTITNTGLGYFPGTYSGVQLTGGNGSGAIALFTIEEIQGSITNAGTGYVPGTYTDIPLTTSGSGTGARGTLEIVGGSALTGTTTSNGSSYSDGLYQSVQFFNTPTTTFTVTVVSNPGTPPPDNIYAINGVNQQVLNLVKGNTYRFDTSDASVSGHPINFNLGGNTLPSAEYIIRSSAAQPGTAGSFVDIVIKPNASLNTFQYYCQNHSGMGADINLSSGSTGEYGSGASANLSVTSGAVTISEWVSGGVDYQNGDTLSIDTLGGTGSGFSFSVTGIAYTGVVDSVTITESGEGYLTTDTLGVNNSNTGGSGSGFVFDITNNPGTVQEFSFTSKGVGYQTGDVLALPAGLTLSSVNLRGEVLNLATTLSIASTTVTLTSTDGIVAGMQVTADLNQPGQVAQSTTVQTVNSPTEISLSANPTADGAASLSFRSPGNLAAVSVSSTSGIANGYKVIVTSGSGTLATPTEVAGINEQTNEITLSPAPTKAGLVNLSIVPPFGDPATDFSYTVGNLGVISDVAVDYGGSGYIVGDVFNVNPTDLTQPINIPVIARQVIDLSFTATNIPTNAFAVGDTIKLVDGEVQQISTSGTSIVAEAGNTYSGLAATGGNGSAATFNCVRDQQGGISASVVSGGRFYQNGDTLTIAGNLIGGSSPTDDATITVDTVSDTTEREIYSVFTSGGVTTGLLVEDDQSETLVSGNDIYKVGSTTLYDLDTVSATQFRFFMTVGGSPTAFPDFTFYVGNKYKFDLTSGSLSGHDFRLSAFPDGIHAPSLVENVTTTLDTGSAQITVTSTTGILVGMTVNNTPQTGDIGAVAPGTTVASIDSSTTLTLSSVPDITGAATLSFTGSEFLDGVTKTSGDLTVKITDSTPNLYYYCQTHPNMGGSNGNEATITIDPNNPKTFGTGLAITVDEISVANNIVSNTATGELNCVTLTATDANVSNAIITGSLSSPAISGTSLTIGSIISTATLNVNAPTVAFTQNVNLGTTIQMVGSNGNITTNGIIKTTNTINVDDKITISSNVIASTPTHDLVLDPADGQLVKVDTITALQIPVGNTIQRPNFTGALGNGAIRFNTETNQYEGYNASTTSWSSLGGVRDIDGNTYILAELTAGANDNTLWFYNDSVNTLKLTSEFMDFRGVKKISSARLGLPAYSVWTANTPVSVGDYIKYRNNLYEVTGAGTTATVGSEPTHTSGVQNNGTSQFTWYSSSVSPLSITEVEELRVAPDKDAPLIINNSLKLGGTTSADWNTIATLTEDLVIKPNPGKKVVIDAYTHFAIPSGNNNQKNTASAIPGSIRFNTEIQQFEGYSGSNWSSLGGVRDVDGNTYIIPETAPAANENILYFYNNNVNTLQLSETALDFTNIDTITTSGLNNLALDTPLVTLSNNETTIDNREATRTFISSAKQYLDLGLSSGLNVDPVLRLDDQGDVYLNTTFGSGTFNGVKVFDGELKEFELADYKVATSTFTLTKGGSESSAVVLYDGATAKGCKVVVVSKSDSGKRSMSEYNVIDNGTDIFHNEFGSLNTSLDQYTAAFDYDPNSDPRITLTLSDDHQTSDIISFTVLVQVIK